jgi:hypothetical protein
MHQVVGLPSLQKVEPIHTFQPRIVIGFASFRGLADERSLGSKLFAPNFFQGFSHSSPIGEKS